MCLFNEIFTLNGVSATSSLGSSTVVAKANVSVIGLEVTGSVNTVNVWGLVDDAQDPSWGAVDDSQNPNWTNVA